MKRAVCRLLLALVCCWGIAGELRAQQPTSVLSKPGKQWSQAGAANHWEDYSADGTTPQVYPALATDGPAAIPEDVSAGQPAADMHYQPQGGVYDDQQPYHDGQLYDDAFHGDMGYDNPPAFPQSSGYWWRDGCWYGSFDFVVWHRTRPGEYILGVDVSQDPVVRLNENFNKQGSALGVEPGARASIGRFLHRDLENRDHSLEFTYLGFNNFEAPDGLRADVDRSLFTPLNSNYGGFNAADFYDSIYRSSFHTFEINYRLRNRPGRDQMVMGPDGFWARQLKPGRTQSLLIGLRGLSIDEHYNWRSTRRNVSTDVFLGDYTVNTDNNLLGVQIGGDCYGVQEKWYYGLRGNAGFYCNFAEGFARILVNDPNDPEPLVQNEAHSQAAAFYGELSFVLGLNITDNLMFRTSYDMALVGGIAMAPDQVSFDDYLADKSPNLSTGGVIFYNGLSVGLEAYW